MGSPILSAGGVLEKGAGDERRVCVVRRTARRDCVLPRAKVNEGEVVRDAAERALLEEAGCKVALHELVQVAERFVQDQRKVTMYWRVTLVDEVTPGGSSQAWKPEWLTPKAALEALSYDDEKDVLRKALALRRSREDEGDELKRTRHRLELLENELKTVSGKLDAEHARSVRSSLDSAARELEASDVMGAWQHLLAAHRTLLYVPGEERLESARVMILAESSEKLPGWRREAVAKLLGRQGKVTADVVAAAALIRDEHGQNEHAKNKLMVKQLGVLTLIIFGMCVLLAGLGVVDGSVEKTAKLFALGFLGGAMSAVVPLASWRSKRIPDL
ncbi:MAG: NUDIX domain-containing protein, partial [Myxococcaceae bacterium]|nr:NUDIX domain-containing protein [Myxococcaceae bacterium]